MICVRIFVSLEVLSSALSDLKIGSNGGIELVSSLGRFLLQFTNFFVLLQESQVVIELVLQVLGCSNISPTPFLKFPFLPSGNV